MGALDLLPGGTARVLKDAAEATAGNPGLLVNVAIGYGGRREIADAVRSLLHEHATRGTSIEELAEILDVEHIAEHLYTAGQPDPDLVIRTSGEQRIGGFLLWQTIHSEFYFCDAYWPAFRKVDFLRALRSYAARQPPLRRLTNPRARGWLELLDPPLPPARPDPQRHLDHPHHHASPRRAGGGSGPPLSW